MQFSVLTLKTLIALEEYTNCQVGLFVPWYDIKSTIVNRGFSDKQANGELERFCYGYECVERFTNHKREIALTSVGRAFIDILVQESLYQSSQVAILMRPAKRKRQYNVIVQESTFFNPLIYEIISKYKFRKGPARDFLRCLPIEVILQFISELLSELSSSSPKQPSSLDVCVKQVEKYGKYWASVGGKYSWFVFAQKYQLPFNLTEWDYYKQLIKLLIRPPEWGGGKTISTKSILSLLGEKSRLQLFQGLGIIRPIWSSQDLQFQLTALGYLMAERESKGFIYEFRIRRESNSDYEIALCDASDFPSCTVKKHMSQKDSIPSLVTSGSKETALDVVRLAINPQQVLPIN